VPHESPDETSAPLGLATRLWFAWLCFFRVLFDGSFAARVWSARTPAQLARTPTPAPGRASTPERAPTPTPTPERAPTPTFSQVPGSLPPSAALQLLSLLQREGRLVDFLQQDIASFPDADVGAAARVVHEGCRKALRDHASIEPVRPEEEGARVVLPEGFVHDEVKLSGAITGHPPYAGVLRHRGWRATRLELPKIVGQHDPRIIAPAEVELP
jgi:hypothetical protein